MQINQEKINEYYKEIWELLTKQGIPIPYLLNWNTPTKYKPTLKEQEELQISPETSDKLEQAYIDRRTKEKELFSKTNSLIKYSNEIKKEYMENELIEFIKKYPKYKDILVEE